MAFKVDSADGATTEPARPAAGALKFFSDALRTTISGWWLNMVQNEICSAVTKFGLTLNKTNDNQLGLAIEAGINAAIAAVKADTQYVPLTAGTQGLGQTVDGTYAYNIDDFVGVDIVPADIRWLHVSAVSVAFEAAYGKIECTMPDGSWTDLNDTQGGGGNDNETIRRRILCQVPINKGQTSVSLRISGNRDPREFTILGASQRTV